MYLWWSFLLPGIWHFSVESTLHDIDTDTATNPQVHNSPIPLVGPTFQGKVSDIHKAGDR